MRNLNKIKKGFTLIELMIVVSIIGILASIALPSYQSYILKAKLTEVTALLSSKKTDAALAYYMEGRFDSLQLLLPKASSSKYVKSIDWSMTGDGQNAWIIAILDNLGELTDKSIQIKFAGNSTNGTVDLSWSGNAVGYIPN
jgi:prepilin-type N-terminal cleavage/methylation domain-containing protein